MLKHLHRRRRRIRRLHRQLNYIHVLRNGISFCQKRLKNFTPLYSDKFHTK